MAAELIRAKQSENLQSFQRATCYRAEKIDQLVI